MDMDMERLKEVLRKRMTEDDLKLYTEQELRCLLDNGWHTEIALCAVTKQELIKPSSGPGLRSGRAFMLKSAFGEGTAAEPDNYYPGFHVTWEDIKQEFFTDLRSIFPYYNAWHPEKTMMAKMKAT